MPAQVVQADQAGDHAVENAFGNLLVVLVDNRRVAHQVANVANQQQRATAQRQFTTGCGVVNAVGVEAAGDGFAAFIERFGQVAFHQAQPVAVDQHLVVSVNGGDRVFAVDDGRQGRFQQQVLDAGGIGLADRMLRVELDFDVQTVILEQNRLWLVRPICETDVFFRVLQKRLAAIRQGDAQLAVFNAIAVCVAMAAVSKGRTGVEQVAGKRDDLGARSGLYPARISAPLLVEITSVPYSASYSEPQRALAAFSA